MVTNNAWNSEDPAQVSKGGTGNATLTDHAVMVGSGTDPVTMVGPGTDGLPLVGQGGSSDPVFAALDVDGGGTGLTSFTPYAVVTGGTTATGPLQQVSGLGDTGSVLTSNGAGALPTWQPSGGTGGGILVQSDYASTFAKYQSSTNVAITTDPIALSAMDSFLAVSSYTPLDSTNVIELQCWLVGTAAQRFGWGFYHSTDTSAPLGGGNINITNFTVSHSIRVSAASTSSRDYTLGTCTVSGSAVNYALNDDNYSSPTVQHPGWIWGCFFVVKEYTPV